MLRLPGAYLPRIVDDELDTLLSALPAVVLEGPKFEAPVTQSVRVYA